MLTRGRKRKRNELNQEGGLYYTNIKNIFGFNSYDMCAKILKYTKTESSRKQTSFLREGFDLNDLKTLRMLIDLGADVHALNNYALCWASFNGLKLSSCW